MSESSYDYLIRKVEGTPPQLDTAELSQLTDVYARVFASEPWNEFTYCATEDNFKDMTTSVGQVCPDCKQSILREAYPHDMTSKYILAEVSRPLGSLYVVDGLDDALAGFGWSYSFASSEQFAQEKYHTDTMRQRVVAELGRRGVSGPFFYISEIGLVSDQRYRGKKLSNAIGDRFVREAGELGMDILLRTSSESPMYFTSMHMGMEQITGRKSYRVSGGDFVYTRDLVSDFVDDENGQRTLFLKKAE